MNTQQAVNHMLEEVAGRTGVSGLRLNDAGLCGLSYVDDLELVLECPENSPMLYLYAPLAPLPDQGTDPLFRQILTANFLGLETGGASFAIHDRYNSVMLCHREAIDRLDGSHGLEKLLSNFISMASHWKKALQPAAVPKPHPVDDGRPLRWEEIATHAIRI